MWYASKALKPAKVEVSFFKVWPPSVVLSTVVAHGGQLVFAGDADWQVTEFRASWVCVPLADFRTVG